MKRAKTSAGRAWTILVLLLCAGAFGMVQPAAAQFTRTAAYQPDNLFSASKRLPSDMRRVLVLPLTGDASYEQAEDSESLYNLLIEELVKSKRFEVIRLTPAQLKACTGRTSWQAEAELPATLLDSLGKKFACNGILFCHLTAYRPYVPLAIGWRLKLIDARGGDILWATDETFDAGNPSVKVGLRSFDRHEQQAEFAGDNWLSLHSPRRFGRYSIATLLKLLPGR